MNKNVQDLMDLWPTVKRQMMDISEIEEIPLGKPLLSPVCYARQYGKTERLIDCVKRMVEQMDRLPDFQKPTFVVADSLVDYFRDLYGNSCTIIGHSKMFVPVKQ